MWSPWKAKGSISSSIGSAFKKRYLRLSMWWKSWFLITDRFVEVKSNNSSVPETEIIWVVGIWSSRFLARLLEDTVYCTQYQYHSQYLTSFNRVLFWKTSNGKTPKLQLVRSRYSNQIRLCKAFSWIPVSPRKKVLQYFAYSILVLTFYQRYCDPSWAGLSCSSQ